VNHHGLRTFAALQHAVLRVYNRLLSSCSSTGGVQAPLRPSGTAIGRPHHVLPGMQTGTAFRDSHQVCRKPLQT